MNKKRLSRVFWIFLISMMSLLFRSCTSPNMIFANAINHDELTKQLVVKSPIVMEMEKLEEPERVLEKEEGSYHLISSELKKVTIEGIPTYISAIVSYELEGDQLQPETTMVTLHDERTDSDYKRQLSYLNMRETEVLWEKTFSFPVIISNYDAEYFQLADIMISKDEELILYASTILESMGLSEDYYHIDTITWSGDSYEKDGEVFREALAEGEKRIRFVDVTYGAEIKIPEVTGYQYISTYEMPVKKVEQMKKEEIEETEEVGNEAMVFEQSESFSKRVLRFLQENITVVAISSTFLLFVIAVFYIWYKSKNGKQKSQDLT